MIKNIFCSLFCLFTFYINAQEVKKNPVQWGFALGIETQSLGSDAIVERTPQETWVETDRNKVGATIGFLGQKKIWKGLAIQSGLSLSYTRNQVHFHQDGIQQYQFTDLELPLYFTLINQKSSRHPLRAKVLFGPRLGWNFANNSGENLQFLRERLAVDLGIGVEINLGKWKLCPEAIYSHGLNNIHDFGSTDFDFLVGRAIRDKIGFRVILLRAK